MKIDGRLYIDEQILLPRSEGTLERIKENALQSLHPLKCPERNAPPLPPPLVGKKYTSINQGAKVHNPLISPQYCETASDAASEKLRKEKAGE